MIQTRRETCVMERCFVFFHTGRAFLLAILLLPLAIYLGGLAISFAPQSRLLQLLAAIAGCASVLWIPCWLDHHLSGKKSRTKK